MLNQDQNNQVKVLKERMSMLQDLDQKQQDMRRLIVSGLDYVVDDHFVDCNISCTKFMDNYFSKLVNMDFAGDISDRLLHTVFLMALLSKEILARTGTAGKAVIDILLYFEINAVTTDVAVKKLFLDAYDCNNISEIEAKHKKISTEAAEWFDQKKKILDKSLEIKTDEAAELATRVEALREFIVKLNSQYNFAGLLHAFEKMLDDKNGESRVLNFWVWGFGGLLVLVPAIELFAISYNWPIAPTIDPANKPPNEYLFYASRIVPFVLVEALLIYYFRIVLQQFYSVKGQIAQLQLRNAVRMFIEHHAEFKSGKDKDAFEKFDTLIFSPIAVQYDKIPSTFDGIEQLAKLMNEFKPK